MRNLIVIPVWVDSTQSSRRAEHEDIFLVNIQYIAPY